MRSIKFNLSTATASGWDGAITLTESYLTENLKADQLLERLPEDFSGDRRASCQSLFLGALRHGHRVQHALQPMLRQKPRAMIEAIFLVECGGHQANLQCCGGGAGGTGTARDCREAQARARALHRQFLEAYGLDEARFPLLKLNPADWHAPFSVDHGGGQAAMQWDELEALVRKGAKG